MIRLARFLRQLRPVANTIITDGSGESYHRFPVADARQFKSYVVEPDRDEFGVFYGFPDDWSDPSRSRQHQFGGHPGVPFEGLAQ